MKQSIHSQIFRRTCVLGLLIPLTLLNLAGAQDPAFDKVETDVKQQLQDSVSELNTLRQSIVEEKIPLNTELRDLEDRLSDVRRQYQRTTRMLDSRTLDLSNLGNEIKGREEEKTYLSTLLSEYIRNFETRLHISELDRYHNVLETAKLAPENATLDEAGVYEAQASLVAASLDRLEDALGGTRFEGKAVDETGMEKTGTFVLLGPAALFRSQDGATVGMAEQRLGSLEPTILTFEDEAATVAAAEVVTSSGGHFPLDPTLGNAHKIENTKVTVMDEIQKGGVVMYPILLLAAAALLVALYKWVNLARMKTASEAQIARLLSAVARHDEGQARSVSASIGGPTGEMLKAGVEHIQQPAELVEEIMYEKILTAKLKLQSLLPFVAISASSAPLLGLLGTVTGIINTFKLITVFGSGDVKMLSGGISEALITTKYGLIVAIPSLLLHAFLSRKARGMMDRMEKAAISFSNQLAKTPFHQPHQNLLGQLTSDQIKEVLRNLSSAEGKPAAAPAPFPTNSAGSMMNPKVVSVGSHQTVAEAIGKIRAAGMDEEYVCVVNEQGKFVGDVKVLQLLTQPDSASVSALVNPDTIYVRIDADQKEVQKLLHANGKTTLPVLDQDGQLVGQVSRNGDGQQGAE